VTVSIDIETQGQHQYVVHLRDERDVGESWFNFTPGLLDDLRADDRSEEDLVRRTAEFLVERQDVADFPQIVELEDVIAAYDDYIDFVSGDRGDLR
jgi:hypothetical protein